VGKARPLNGNRQTFAKMIHAELFLRLYQSPNFPPRPEKRGDHVAESPRASRRGRVRVLEFIVGCSTSTASNPAKVSGCREPTSSPSRTCGVRRHGKVGIAVLHQRRLLEELQQLERGRFAAIVDVGLVDKPRTKTFAPFIALPS